MLIGDGYAIKGDVEEVKGDKKSVKARWGELKGDEEGVKGRGESATESLPSDGSMETH